MPNSPTAHAQVSQIQTGAGPMLKVAIITASDIQWRTYPLQPVDQAASRAIRSCGLRSAFVQLRLA